MLHSREISEGWRVCDPAWLEPPGFLAFGKLDWLRAEVPGHVHHDLVAAGVIGDPFFGQQELGCQWVDERVWVYETSFTFEPNPLLPRCVLSFEGLDTVCIVHLNGASIAEHDNMFVPLELDVAALLKSGPNTLRVTFQPALTEARKRRALYFTDHYLPEDLVRFEERAFVRKAPYMFGWDWGPRLISAGIWKPVRLLQFWGRIQSVDVQQTFDDEGRVHVRCSTQIGGGGRIVHVLEQPGTAAIMFDDAAEISLSDPQLWWPAGLGPANLYSLTTYLLPHGVAASLEQDLDALAHDVRRARLGLRRVEVVREPDAWGESFRFLVNGVPVFCAGANWIPDHSYPSKVTRRRLTEQLDRVLAMNMNMLRIWGGGVYESDDFYELCDERGILVWQDFPFACSYSPDDEAHLRVIEQEAEINVRRLRHHPSLVLWCGNNENQMMFEAKWDDANRHPSHCIGERIWAETLPNLVARLDPGRPYLITSPHSPAHSTALANADGCGDQHNWDVWHGRGDWVHYRESKARFASEYGFASAPTPQAWAQICGEDWQHLPVDHPVARWHDKTKKGYSTFRSFVELHYARASTLAEWTYLSQLNQRDALRAAIEHYRMSAFCDGSLVWQLNDCWPVQSWSVIDSTGSFKAAAYEMRRLYAPLLASVTLEKADADSPSSRACVRVALHNSQTARRSTIEVEVRDALDGSLLAQFSSDVTLEPGDVRKVFDFAVTEYDPTRTIVWVSCAGVTFSTLLCEPKNLLSAGTHFHAVRRGADVYLTSDAPALDVFVSCRGTHTRLTDNFLNFPTSGSTRLSIPLECQELELRWLGGVVNIPVTTSA